MKTYMNNDWFHDYFINELKAIGRNCIPTDCDQTDRNQSDWNQNDDTQPDYVKNRPFYTGDQVETVLVDETTESFAENEAGIYVAINKSIFEAAVGKTYKVYWDGIVYECACAIVENLPAIGNFSIVGYGSDTGEPFVMAVADGVEIMIFAADTSTSHTFSISAMAQSVVKIDPKYLPDNVTDNTDNSLNITGGAVGQIAKIAAVDDNGKPTVWEAVDLPSAVTDGHINELINTALGAIGIAERGAY